ncbi:MAG: hypothetical protein IJD71_01635, partial [Clostridia bacterium]|nr:hypothetical protein [Clostridia bacterium]
QWKIFSISYEGLRSAVYITIRLIYLIMGSSVMTYTTTPTELTDGLERSFKGLNKFCFFTAPF